MEIIKDIAATQKVEWGTLADAIDRNFDEASTGIQTVAQKVDLLDMASPNYCVGEWQNGELSPTSVNTIGDTSILDKWDFYLIDTTDNTGETNHPVGKLKRNNLLRFVDGSFAPVIGITEAMRAECDVELYLDNTQTNKYCDAGAFDAEAFYNQYGMTQKLYNAAGEEVRILRPYETTETKYTIGLGRADKIYLLDNVVGKSGKRWKGIFASPTTWDGIDTTLWGLDPTAISPCPVCTIGNKTRSFFYVYEGESNCKSSNGINNRCTMFSNGRTYPRVNDMNQVNDMTWSRANNADPDAPYPFAEGGYHALNTFINCLEIRYGTKYLHKESLFSGGICSNDSVSEAGWTKTGGIRYKKTADSTWKYANWNTTPSDMFYNASGGKTNMNEFLSNYCPKEQCMESQMAASFAVETGVQEGEEFEFYGATYYYRNIVDTKGLADGEMNVKVYKKMSQTFNAYDELGAETSFDVEVILRMALYAGANLSGDVFAYCGGGYEQVGTCVNAASASVNNPVDIYLEPDQKKWLKETSVTKTNLGTFDFEKSYMKLGSSTNLGDSYAKERENYAAWKTAKGGSLSTGECYYAWDNNYWSSTAMQRVRISARFRGSANYAYCSPRNLYAHHAASATTRHHAGFAQVRISVNAVPMQSE